MNSIKSNRNKVENLEYVEPEIWKPIKGYEGMYQVSNKGRVRSLKRKVGGKGDSLRTIPNKMLRQVNTKDGYKKLNLHNKTKKGHRVHRLVAFAFIPNPKNKPCVNHKNGIKTDNRVENLEWCTHGENVRHGIKNGLLGSVGQTNHNSKLTKKEVLEIRATNDLECFTKTEIANAYNVTLATISSIVNRKTWKHI